MKIKIKKTPAASDLPFTSPLASGAFLLPSKFTPFPASLASQLSKSVTTRPPWLSVRDMGMPLRLKVSLA